MQEDRRVRRVRRDRQPGRGEGKEKRRVAEMNPDENRRRQLETGKARLFYDALIGLMHKRVGKGLGKGNAEIEEARMKSGQN